MKRWAKILKADRDTALATVALIEQDTEAHNLRKSGRNRRSGSSESKTENQNRIENHIEDSACRDSNHREGGKSLKTQEIVHDKRAHHKRGRKEDIARILHRIRFNRLRRTEEHNNLIDPKQAENAKRSSDNQSRKKCR